ncbi:MAG: hypothetical protein ACYC0C_00830 [Devosia sp.]
MSRLVPSLAALLAAMVLPTPVLAADWMEDFREPYAEDWALPPDDPISIELGLRYWYSMGQHRMTVLGGNYASDDVSHIVEGHLRIDDDMYDFYAKGLAGYSAVINNTYSTPTVALATSNGGSIHYFGSDIGYTPFGNDDVKFGGFVGYQFWNDSPDMGRENYLTSAGGGNSEPNNIQYHMIRLGLSGRAEFGDAFDITAEAAVIPYALLGGTYGALAVPVGPGESQGSAGTLGGWLYGAAGEAMARFHPTENLTIGLGGRAWYLQGQADVTFDTRETATPVNQTHWITKTTNFSTLRYGLLGELTYRF